MLKPGVILSICRDGVMPDALYLQAHQAKSIPESTGERLRLMLNDGQYAINGVFKPSEAQNAIENFKRYCILKITQYEITPTNNGKIFLVVDRAEVVEQGEKSEIKFESLDDYLKEHPEDNNLLKGQLPPRDSTMTPSPAATMPKKTVSKPPPKYQNLYSIDQLSPYQNSWTIKARVSFKSDMKHWSNQRGDGKLFNVNLLDETGEIRATAFNQVAEKFWDLLEENKVFYISKASMQMAKPQFSNLKHQYELQFDKDTIIEPCDDDSDVPKLHFDFVALDQVQNLENGAVIDVIGILKDVKDKQEIVAKSTGKPFDRRDIVLVDKSQFAVNIGLWNKHAREFDVPVGSVVAFKGCRVQDFGGKSLSLIPAATIVVNPDIEEAYKIKGWYDAQGSHQSFKSIAVESGSSGATSLTSKQSILERKTIKQVQDEKLGLKDKPDYFSLKATISFIKTDNFCYPACRSEGCNKKLLEQDNGTWRCEKCNINHPEPNYRYILTVSVVDETGQMWLTLFDEQATQLLGLSAAELLKLKNDAEDPSIESVGENALKNFINENISFKEVLLRVRGKVDSYQGQDRARFTVASLAKVDYLAECEALVEILSSYSV
ncbi:hypothetical protein KL942_001111 [Ogataea angusta]|uniref:Replication protein A subunit n=1 Tax=Pichia angusta TaxID=870730 RepID=A0ABQ7S1G6_PICAN|nr:hypothetical protein KL943_005035 [Ogataea angusta]KAG7842373.1 hypothetical protein KL942_001111 [Ogataea angusta]KAG7851832.1 hypothetical protein KL940_000714 [Ogataea angusta]KAG7853672.1 hypothetical protein KL941_000722 [Ogataea angusta]KAG7864040.1 hypothetical protein KL919_000068 [Ogataea angusta]